MTLASLHPVSLAALIPGALRGGGTYAGVLALLRGMRPMLCRRSDLSCGDSCTLLVKVVIFPSSLVCNGDYVNSRDCLFRFNGGGDGDTSAFDTFIHGNLQPGFAS